MKISYALVLGVIAAVVPVLTVAQVYEREDAEGNPVFSDMPSPGAEKVEIAPANVADSVDVPERPPGSGNSASESGPVIEVPNQRNDAVEKEFAEERPYTVLDGEERDEIRDAEPRRKVHDAEKRYEVQGEDGGHGDSQHSGRWQDNKSHGKPAGGKGAGPAGGRGHSR